MPRAFLVKKTCVSTCRRNWSELPDEERGEIYVPGEAPSPRAPNPTLPRGRWGLVERPACGAQWRGARRPAQLGRPI